MCKVQVTCYISLMLVIVVNGLPLTSRYNKYLQYAIHDVTELEKMSITTENVVFYTPDDFSNEEHRMEAFWVYLAEMEGLKEENDGDTKISKDIDNIIKNLCAFAEARRMEASEVCVAEVKASQEEIGYNKDIDNIKNLGASAQIIAPQNWEGYQMKNTQEFLKGLRELLQSMYSSLVTVEHH